MAKTLRSRIAAVAVVALGAGMLQAAPAFAGYADAAEVTAVSASLVGPANVNSKVTVQVGFTQAGMDLGDEVALAAVFTGQIPGNGTAPTITAAAGYVADATSGRLGVKGTGGADPAIAATQATGGAPSFVLTSMATAGSGGSTAPSDGSVTAGRFSFVPTVAGTYSFLVWHEDTTVSSSSALSGSEVYKVVNITVGSGVVSTVTVTQPVAGTIAAGTSGNGGVFKVSLKDADGKAVLPATTQNVALTVGGSAVIKKINGGSALSPTPQSYNLSPTQFDQSGNAYVNIVDGTEESVTVTATLVGSTTITSNVTATFRTSAGTAAALATTGMATTAPAGFAASKYVDIVDTQVARTDDGTNFTGAFTANTTKASITFKVASTTASEILKVTATDSDRTIFANGGLTGNSSFTGTSLVHDVSVKVGTTADATTTSSTYGNKVGTFTIAATLSASKGYSLNAGAAQGVTGAAPAATKVTNSPTTTIVAVNGATNVLKATLTDQFGNPLEGLAASVQIASGSRNAALAAKTVYGVTDAKGEFSYTLTDAAPTSTTTSDTVTFTLGGVAGSAMTINYVESSPVASLTATAGATTQNITTNDDPSYADVTITVTAKNALGNTVAAGVPVTVSAPAGSFVDEKSTTKYTNSSGVVTFAVYATTTGKATYTFTAGAVSKTASITWANQSSDARVVSISAAATTGAADGSANPVTVTVKDGFGNTVSGATVTISSSGAGAFQNGVVSAAYTTDANGQVVLAYQSKTAGTATLKAALSTTTYTQTLAPAGYADADKTTAVTGAAAGVASATAAITYTADASTSALQAQVTALAATITSIQTAMSTLVASTTATMTLIQSQIAKIMKKLNIK